MEKPAEKGTSYEFGEFRVDASQRLIFRAGHPVPLAPKVLETLLVLVENNGALVTKDELMARLWPDTFVEESNLTQNIFQLRKVLGEAPDRSTYIETVPRRGYRFRGAVKTLAEEEGIEWILAKRKRARIAHEETTDDESEARSVSLSTAPPAAHVLAGDNQRTRAQRFAPARVIVPVMIGVGLLAAGLGLNRVLRKPATLAVAPPATASTISLKRLTYDSKAFDPAVSPSGEYVAYRVHDGETDSIKLRNIANGSTVEIMPPIREGYSGLTFSPDGNYLYFTTRRPGVKNGTIARVPTFGGTPQYLVQEVWSAFTLSPDGRQIAFFRGYGSIQDLRLVVANVDGSGERELARSKPEELWFEIWSAGPSWSPDGHRIVALAGGRESGAYYAYLFEVKADDGTARQVSARHWYKAGQVAWLPDGKGLLVVAQEKPGAPYQLWHVAYPSGSVGKVTNDLLDYDKVSLSADGRVIVIQQETIVSHVWVVPEGDASQAQQLTSGATARDGTGGVAWTPDGRLLFTSTRSGANDIWIMNADGTGVRQLTADTGGANWRPRATANGRYVAFCSTRNGWQSIWRMDADGGNARQLTSGNGEATPFVSADDQWLYYTNYAVTPAAIERIPFDGGTPVRLTSKYDASDPVVSPDGKLIAYEHYDDQRGWRTALLSAEGGEPLKVFDFHAFRGGVRWSQDGKALIYANANRADNLWRQSIAGGPPQQITHFTEDKVGYLDISPDGKRLAVARGRANSDLVLITNFR